MPVEERCAVDGVSDAITLLCEPFKDIAKAYTFLAEFKAQYAQGTRFDVAAIQEGGGYKVLLAHLSRDGEFTISSHSVLKWVTKNVHFPEGDEVRTVAMLWNEEDEEIQELPRWIAMKSIFGFASVRFMPPGMGEADFKEVEEMKSNLLYRQGLEKAVRRIENGPTSS